MKKEILILTGSARAGANSTLLAEAFADGARESGHLARVFSTAKKQMSGCLGCDLCWSMGRACVIKDDFQNLAPLLETADVIVFSFPMYWSTMPAQMKAVVDRLYAYTLPENMEKLAIKESVLMTCGECESVADFDIAREVYHGVAEYFHWKERGEILVPRVKEAGDVNHTDALLRARALGKEIG